MKTRSAKAIEISCLTVAIAAFFYFRGLPSAPDSTLGRIYPLNNHGLLLYMTRGEQLQQEIAFGIFAALAVIAEIVNSRMDPFQQKKLPTKRPEPWNHRWGP